MSFTVAQTTAFFESAGQIGLSNRTRVQLQTEGVTTVEDLGEFTDDDWDTIPSNMKKPPRIADPANPGQMIDQEPFVLGARSLKRLKVAAQAVRYYEQVDRALIAGSMHWDTLKNFDIHWKAIVEKKDKDAPTVPKINNNTLIHKWADSFNIFLRKVVGARNTPLSYVIRENDAAAAAPPALAVNQPHSTEHESVEGELVARTLHEHPLFNDNRATVFRYLEEATRGTSTRLV